MAAPEAQNLAQVKGVSCGTYNIPALPRTEMLISVSLCREDSIQEFPLQPVQRTSRNFYSYQFWILQTSLQILLSIVYETTFTT